MLYMTIVIIIMAIVNWFMPKRMDRRDILVLIISYVEIVVDLYFDKVFHLYYFGESNVLSGAVLTMKLVTAPLFGIPYLNFMPEKFSRFIPYWLFWALFSTFLLDNRPFWLFKLYRLANMAFVSFLCTSYSDSEMVLLLY